MTTALATDVEFAGRLRIAAGRIARDGLGQKRVDGMTPSRMTALAVLATEEPLRMGELAARLGISAPTVSRLVDHLAELGFLERVADEDDHRATRVRLSARRPPRPRRRPRARGDPPRRPDRRARRHRARRAGARAARAGAARLT